MKTIKIAALILVTIVAIATPASAAVLLSQNVETKANRMVDIAINAQETVIDVVKLVTSDAETMNLISENGLETELYRNISLCVKDNTIITTILEDWIFTGDGEGWLILQDANIAINEERYEDAIEYAREALTIFRDTLRSIHLILFEVGIEIGELVEPQTLQEAIDRSKDRIDELRDLLADEDLLAMLDQAEGLLIDAQRYLDSEDIDAGKDSLLQANLLINQVCQELKEIARELILEFRISDYCAGAYRYRENFRERFGQAESEGFDVNGFLQEFGYQNEEEFMTKFQQMIQRAENGEDLTKILEDLEYIGHLIRQMDQNLTQEMHQHRAQHGQEGIDGGFGQDFTSGYGQNGGTYGGGRGAGQMSYGADH